MDRQRLELIIAEARRHLLGCLAYTIESEGWKLEETPEQILALHMEPDRIKMRERRQDILSGMLYSCQNKQEANRVIEGSVAGGWSGLATLLLYFEPDAILAKWSDHTELLRELMASGKIEGQRRESKLSRWPQFCKSVLSASRFMTRFPTGADFIAWVETFRTSPDTAAALPLILEKEIHGFGVALACDFLKELGFVEFPKPDVHIRILAEALGISSADSDYLLMRDIMALKPTLAELGMTPYGLDKLLWLIGSGRFYRIVSEGYELQIGRQRDVFIDRMKRRAKAA